MDYSGDLAVALEQLRMARVAYCEAAKEFKECQKTRSECFKDFQKFKDKITDTEFRRTVLDEAFVAEKAAKEHMQNAMKEFRAKQSSYDKLKHMAASAKKAQKDAQAREKRYWKKSKKQKKEKEKEKKKGQKQKEQSEKKFWRDGYEETPPRNPPQPRKWWKQPLSTHPQTQIPPSAWKLECDKALSDRGNMTSFPDPPYSSCGLVGCAARRNQRALKACQCNIAEALRRDPEYPESLKSERLRWHPDKFSVCLEEHRLIFQAKAKEIFVVANHLYERDRK